MGRTVIVTALIAFLLSVAALSAEAGRVEPSPPADPDPNARYMFFMHGGYVEQHGLGRDYEYEAILRALADKGFVVIGEARGPTKFGAYARGIADQVETLLDAGVPAGHITVAGHSKGGFLALMAASFIRRGKIKFGILAACGLDGTPYRRNYLRFFERRAKKIKGRFLVMWEAGDVDTGHCDEALAAAGAPHRNLVLKVGGGHQLFYTPRAAWIDPLAAFALSQ